MSVLVLVSSVTLAVLALVGWVVSVADSAPNLSQLKPQVQGQLSQVFAANGQSLGYIQSDNLRTPVTSRQIPEILRQATVAIEDRRFYQHGALDYTGIMRAAIKDFQRGQRAAGRLDADDAAGAQPVPAGTTTREPALQDRSGEARRAADKIAQQAWILNNYLNDVPYGTVGGQTAYGVGAASRCSSTNRCGGSTWRRRRCSPECRRRRPTTTRSSTPRSRATPPRGAAGDGRVALHHPAQADAAERAAASGRPERLLQHRRQPTSSTTSQQQLIKRFGADTRRDAGGLKVYTTIDPRDQSAARRRSTRTKAVRASRPRRSSRSTRSTATSSRWPRPPRTSRRQFNYASSAHRHRARLSRSSR